MRHFCFMRHYPFYVPPRRTCLAITRVKRLAPRVATLETPLHSTPRISEDRLLEDPLLMLMSMLDNAGAAAVLRRDRCCIRMSASFLCLCDTGAAVQSGPPHYHRPSTVMGK